MPQHPIHTIKKANLPSDGVSFIIWHQLGTREEINQRIHTFAYYEVIYAPLTLGKILALIYFGKYASHDAGFAKRGHNFFHGIVGSLHGLPTALVDRAQRIKQDNYFKIFP
jgi:hypothetical protein